MSNKRNKRSCRSDGLQYGLIFKNFLLLVSTFAAIVYAYLTWGMLNELKQANDLQSKFQNQVLQPVLTIDVERRVINKGKENESWKLSANISNEGQVIARQVRTQIFWDSNSKIFSFNRQFGPGEVVLPPGGGNVIFEETILADEATAILATRDLFFHTCVEYLDASAKKYVSSITHHCYFEEGKGLVMEIVNSSYILVELASVD